MSQVFKKLSISQKYKGAFIWKILLLLVLLLTFCVSSAIPLVPETDEPGNEIIRFHVKAHSNDPDDQEIKNYLASRLIQIFGPLWNRCQNSRQLYALLTKDKEEIEETACRILEEKGIYDSVEVEFAKRAFPARFYGNRFYPPGEYDSLTIKIGSGRGENWWCVLFPPLCLTVFPVSAGDNQQNETKKETMVTNEQVSRGEKQEQETADLEQETNKWRFWIIDFLAKIFCG